MILTFIGTFIGMFILALITQPLWRLRKRMQGDFWELKPKDNALLQQHRGKNQLLWSALIALVASTVIILLKQ